MEARELSKFSKDDVAKARALKSVLSKAEFPLKGDAIVMVASLLNWFNGMETKIEDQLKRDALEGAPKIGSMD